MPKPKSFSARLVGDPQNNPPPNRAASNDLSFGEKLRFHSDIKVATDLVGEQAGLEFDVEHPKLASLGLARDELNAEHAASSERLEELNTQLADTAEYLKCAPQFATQSDSSSDLDSDKDGSANSDKDDNANGGTDAEEKTGSVKFKHYRGKDKIMLIFLVPLMVLTMGMGASNVYANLMASGTPVFLDDPWLAVAISTLLPIGATAIKFVANFITVDRWRRRYALGVYISTFSLLMIWAVLFALNFSGVSSDIDWDAMGEADNYASALVWSQLTLEILVAAALFLAIDDITFKYSPDVWMTNMAYVQIEKSQKAHRIAHEKLCEKRNETITKLRKLEDERQAYINDKIADYTLMRARHANANRY